MGILSGWNFLIISASFRLSSSFSYCICADYNLYYYTLIHSYYISGFILVANNYHWLVRISMILPSGTSESMCSRLQGSAWRVPTRLSSRCTAASTPSTLQLSSSARCSFSRSSPKISRTSYSSPELSSAFCSMLSHLSFWMASHISIPSIPGWPPRAGTGRCSMPQF